MNRKFRSIACLLLALTLTLSLAACGGDPETTTAPTETDPVETTVPTVPTEPTETPTIPTATVDNPLTYLYLAQSTEENYYYMTVSAAGEESAYIEYATPEERKLGEVEAAVLPYLTQALEESGLLQYSAQGEESKSYYSVDGAYADGTGVAYSIHGEAPEGFVACYEKMLEAFKVAAASLPVYIPRPAVMEGVDPEGQAAMEDVMMSTGILVLDQMFIEDVPLDEFFMDNAALSSSEGIASATRCKHHMLTTPYSVVILELENAADVDKYVKDFENHMPWREIVCGAPDNALIAVKDNMVLRLMGKDQFYVQTKSGVEAAGWTVEVELTNPDNG